VRKTVDNIKIKRNKFFWGFVHNLKVCASNLQLWLTKVYRYLSPKKIYFFNPFFVSSNLRGWLLPINIKNQRHHCGNIPQKVESNASIWRSKSSN